MVSFHPHVYADYLQCVFKGAAYSKHACFKPNTHRRRRRDETVELRRVGVGGVYMNSQLADDHCRRIR